MPRVKAPSAGLGIEDELSFGSDEDLLAEVGEIPITSPVVGGESSTSHVSGKTDKAKSSGRFRSLGGGKKDGDKEKRKRTATEETVRLAPPLPTSSTGTTSVFKKDKSSSKTLAKSSLVIDPSLVESVLDVTSTSTTRPPTNTSTTILSSKNKSRDSLSMSGSSSHKSPSITSSSKNDLVSLTAVGGGKKKGFMSSLKGLGGNTKNKKEDPFSVFGISNKTPQPQRPEVASLRSRDSFGGRSDYSRQQSFDIPSSSFSSPRTGSSDNSIKKHTLAPISTSPFQAHPPDLTPDSTIRSSISNSSKRPSISSFARRASVMTSTSFATSEQAGEESPVLSKAVLHKFPIVDQPPPERPGLITRSTTSSLAIPASPMLNPEIVSVLLPSFPSSISALSSIQILQATVIRRTVPSTTYNGGMPDKEKSSSIRSLTSVLSSSNNANSSTTKPIWITQQLVLTSFKVGESTPQSTPDPNEYLSPSRSRTIAHLHLFSVPGSSSAGRSPNHKGPIGLGIGGGSSQTFGRRPSLPSNAMNEEVELERKVISKDSTAGVWNHDEGGRKFVMRIGFGTEDLDQQEAENEWVVEMRNADQLQEWIRQIKSIAIVIRAEREGHGHAIRNAYSDAVRGDDLALELDLQRSSSPSVKSPASRPESVSVPSVLSGNRDSAFSDIPAHSATMEKVPSAARAESPDMLPPTPLVEDVNGRLGQLDLGREIGIPRSKSLSRGQVPSPTYQTPSAPTARNGSIVSNSGSAISRIGGSLHRHAKQGSWSSSASGGSGHFSRRNGNLPPAPPPPMAPPPNVPLPALPAESPLELDVSVVPGSKERPSPEDIQKPEEGVLRSPGGIEFITPFQSPSASFDPISIAEDVNGDGKLSSEARLSLPSAEDDAILRLRQSTGRSTSLPDNSMQSPSLGGKARKDRLLNAFKPIPLVPELETSPKLGVVSPTIGGMGDSRTSSPLTIGSSSPSVLPEMIRPPTPPRRSTLTSNVNSNDTGNGGSMEFHTPTETPIVSFPGPNTQSTEGSILSTPSTINEPRPDLGESKKSYTSSINSFTPSVESRSTTASSSRRRLRERKIAVDIMSEFSETPSAAFDVDGEEEIREDRPRVIRFA
ncbi:hypothetical protein I302_101858 [Kwoniella bestiolae CBS 10118]|uniref:Uncharacterized protein n=1 Tax=Kwoniella bestiolae CBS 10118 TaxID=1296100 RepID=A0A1B9GDE6_9TREE|nr:hypothetical protein I302_00537 [Kwoniella bestiolae CBS 10118]OCF29046.1 hypothetical protein I302_00537 [Kwoniella bestiolae CBS 10118]